MSEVYEFKDIIGQGRYGEVFKALNKTENKYYAIKRLNFKDISDKEKKSITKEVSILKNLKHPNILSYKDSFIDEDNYYNIVTTFCEGGDIYKKIQINHQKNEYFSEEQILNWMIQLLLGLSYIHGKGIIHRDIKPQNIFIQNKYLICIGDFGIAKNINQGQTQTMGTSIIGTPLYMSPESFNNSKFNKFPSDIWSMGCCLYELCNLNHAFGGDSWNAVFNKVREGKRASLNKKYSNGLRNIIDLMLDINPRNRPTIAQLLENNTFLKPKVAKYIEDFIINYSKYDATEEHVMILKEQAEKFKIFKNDIKEINEKKDNYMEKKKKIIPKIEELKKIKNYQNKNINRKDFSNPTSKEKEEYDKKYSVNKNKKINTNANANVNKKNDYSRNSKNKKNNELVISNDNKKKQYVKEGKSPPVLNNNRNLRKNNFSNNNKKKTSNRPVTTKNLGDKNNNNISIIKRKNKNNEIKEINNYINKNNNIKKIKSDDSLDEIQFLNNIVTKKIVNDSNNDNFYNSDSEMIINSKNKILTERINYFKNKCIESLGKKIFIDAYNYVAKNKKNKNKNNDINNREIRENLMNMFGKDSIGYWHLIDQILMLEEILNDK